MAAAVAMTGCSGGQDLRAAATAPITVSLATPPRPFLPPSSNSSPPAALASRASAAPTSSRSLDVTQDAAARYVPPVAAESPAPAPTVATGTRYVDPLAVAAGYLTRRLTYRFDDLAGYRAALTAPAFTTPAFMARSAPNGVALAQVKTAQETSVVQVGDVELAHEAPHTATTTYVAVACTTTVTYRGGVGTTPATWVLRLVQAPPGRWRVDGVLSTG